MKNLPEDFEFFINNNYLSTTNELFITPIKVNKFGETVYWAYSYNSILGTIIYLAQYKEISIQIKQFWLWDIIYGKQYIKKNLLHRIDGPARIYDDNIPSIYFPYILGFLPECDYWINGEKYSSKEDWFKALTPQQKYEVIWNND